MPRPGGIEIAAFLLAYLAFFVVWAPNEAFLFSAPFVLPFWLVLHHGHVKRQDSPLWLIVMVAACVLVIANNAHFISQLHLPGPSHEYVR